MKSVHVLAVALTLIVPSLHAEKIALVNGTVINPGDAKVIPNALVVIEGDHISAVGNQATAVSTEGAKIIDCAGKFILPGYTAPGQSDVERAALFRPVVHAVVEESHARKREHVVKRYIEKRGGTADQFEKRWQVFEELLSSPRLPSGLH